MRTPTLRALLNGLVLTLIPAATLAVPVLPGSSEALPGTTLAASPELAGSVIYDDASQYYDFNPAPLFLAGHRYRDRVVRSDATGNVIIAPRLIDPTNNFPSRVFVDGFSLTGYAGWATDISYRTDLDGDRGPTLVERSADGDELMFTFGFPLLIDYLLGQPQETSLFVNILTDAPTFETTGRATFFGRSEASPGQVLTFSIGGIAVPAAAQIPLPASVTLLIPGLAWSAVAARAARRLRRPRP